GGLKRKKPPRWSPPAAVLNVKLCQISLRGHLLGRLVGLLSSVDGRPKVLSVMPHGLHSAVGCISHRVTEIVHALLDRLGSLVSFAAKIFHGFAARLRGKQHPSRHAGGAAHTEVHHFSIVVHFAFLPRLSQ